MILFRIDFYGEIRTPVFTQHAANAVFRAGSHHLIVAVQLKHMLWAELDTDAAPLAPFPVDNVFLEFRFCHTIVSLTKTLQGNAFGNPVCKVCAAPSERYFFKVLL